MAITEQQSLYIGILNNGVIELRSTRQFYEGTELLAEKHFRQVLEPGQDVSSFSVKVRAVCNLIWTPAVIAAYLASKPTAP